MEPPKSGLITTGGEDVLRVGRMAAGACTQAGGQPILTAAFGTSGTCWGLLCHPGCWRAPCWWDRKTSRCAKVTKFSCTHSEKAQRRTVSGGSLRGHQDPENSSFTFKFFWVGYMLSTPIVCLHQAWGYHTPHPHPSPRTTPGTGCTQRPACGSEAGKDNEKVQNPLQGWLFMGKGVHI